MNGVGPQKLKGWAKGKCAAIPSIKPGGTLMPFGPEIAPLPPVEVAAVPATGLPNDFCCGFNRVGGAFFSTA